MADIRFRVSPLVELVKTENGYSLVCSDGTHSQEFAFRVEADDLRELSSMSVFILAHELHTFFEMALSSGAMTNPALAEMARHIRALQTQE